MKKTLLAGFVIFLLASFLNGCAGYVELKGKDYPESAKLNYEEGLKYLSQENYEVASQYFSLVKSKFSFSMYATTAELLAADTLLKRELYNEAISAYKIFQKNHPSHACVTYSQYKAAESYFEQINEDWWFMPPSFERDQEITEKALREFQQLIYMEKAEDYHFDKDFKPVEIQPCENRNYDQVQSMLYTAKHRIEFCYDRLIAREIYVAEFYRKTKKPAGCVSRVLAAIDKYPQVKENLETVELLADCYQKADMYKRARAVWEWVVKAYPESDMAEDSADKIREITLEEGEYIKKREKELAKKAKRTEELRPEMEEAGIYEIDPDPDPNALADIPFDNVK